MIDIQAKLQEIGPFIPGADDDFLVCRCEEVTRGEIRRAARCEQGRRGVGETDLRAAQGAGEAAPQTAPGGRDGRSGAGRNREADRGVRCEIRRRDRIQRSRLQGLQRPESPLRPPDARVGEGVVRT